MERVFASLREQLGWGNRGTHHAPRITAEIRRGDETGLRSDDVRGRSFAPIGQTPVGRVSSRREGLSIISTVTNRGQMRWKIFDGALDAEILIEFMGRLIKGATKKALSDSRQPQSPSQQAGQGVAGSTQRADRGLLSARINMLTGRE